jgi:hypothetical protein
LLLCTLKPKVELALEMAPPYALAHLFCSPLIT